MTDPKPTVGQQPEPEEMMNMRFMPCLDCGKDLRLCKCKPKTSPNAKLYAVHVSELMSAEMADGEDWVLVQRDGTALETNPIRALVDEQAEDGGLWFVAETITEDYLQLALRKLHAVIEATLLVTEGSKPVASPVTLQVNTPEVALSILRTGVENALGFYQVTHIHSFLREALKACEREPLTEADEEYPVTLSGEVECVLSNDNPKVGDCSVCKTSIWHKQGYMQDDDGKSYHIMCRVMQSSYEQIAALKAENAALLAKLAPVAVTLSEGQPKSFKSEQCVCGHGSIQHEWEDEFTSCCMAHLRLFNGVGEGKPCMCTGYKPLSEGQETQEKKS